MRKLLDILTPENVYVEYELAGIGSRTLAIIIDSLIQGAMLLVVLIALILAGIDIEHLDWVSSVVIAVAAVILFVIFFGYYIFFEMIMNGQTPGKKAVKLRVVKQNGEPITFFDSFVRNLLRIVDFLPTFYLAGAIIVIFTRHYKRIGDFAANTIVVKTAAEKRKSSTLEELIVNYSRREEEDGEVRLNVYPVNNLEYGVLKEFLSRRNELGSRFPVFVRCLSSYFIRKYGLKSLPFGEPIRFFEAIVDMNSGR